VALLLAAAVPARSDDVTVVIAKTAGTCRVHGMFQAPVSGAVAWEVLTDYDGIGRFVAAVETSHVERREDGRVRIHQVAVAHALLIKRRVRVMLDVIEEPSHRIVFRDVLGQDFHDYVGEWRISEDSTGVQVNYMLEVRPRALVVRTLCKGTMNHMARELLQEVRVEMLRRRAE
jgi:hypothetical protein